MKPHPLRHATHAVLLLMMLATAWLIIRAEALSQGTLLLGSAILFVCVSCVMTLLAVFCMPELPRLKREKGRSPAYYEMWVAGLFYLISGVLLALDLVAFEAARPISYAAANAVLSTFAACVCVANQRMSICWNDEGFLLRTALGSIHHFRWEQLTGHDTWRGSTFLRVAGKSYMANLSSKQVISFLRASRRS